MRSFLRASSSITGIFLKREKSEQGRTCTKGGSQVKMKSEIGVTFLQAKTHQIASKPPEARVGSRQVLRPRPKKEPRLQTAWCWASGLQQNWGKFLLFRTLFVVPCYDSKPIHLHYKLIPRNQNEVIKDIPQLIRGGKADSCYYCLLEYLKLK